VVRHARHIARVAGIQSVAIGSDFEGGILPPRELADARGFPALAKALRDAGFPATDVQRVLSGNARRLLCRAIP
jgi:membrane dipeptidase